MKRSILTKKTKMLFLYPLTTNNGIEFLYIIKRLTTKYRYLIGTKDSDYQLTGSTSGTPLATQDTPDGLPPSSLPTQQNNHLQGLTGYNEYNNYPTLPVSIVKNKFPA